MAFGHFLRLPDVLVDLRVAPTLIEDVLTVNISDPDPSDSWTSNFHGNFANHSVQRIKLNDFGLIALEWIWLRV